MYKVRDLSGNLINDKSDQCDRLGYHVYAETLAGCLHNSPAPLTVGIFGSWGIGKTFIAKRVKEFLMKLERGESISSKTSKNRTTGTSTFESSRILFIVTTIVLGLATSVVILDHLNRRGVVQLSSSKSSNVSSSVIHDPFYYASWTSFWLVILIFLVTSLPVFFRCSNKSWKKIKKYSTVLLYTLFTIIPLKRASTPDASIVDTQCDVKYEPNSNNQDKDRKKLKTKYIFVDFNAWQYVGSDVLWAGIILNLAKAVEKEFGAFSVRLFRLFQKGNGYEESHNDDISRNGFYLRPNGHETERELNKMLRHFGLLANIKKDEGSWWFIKYYDPIDEEEAYLNLMKNHYEVKKDISGPSVTPNPPGNMHSNPAFSGNGSESESGYAHKVEHNGFWQYMKEKPRKICCCPKLFCFVTFITSFIASLVCSSILMASTFGANLKQQSEGDFSTGMTLIAVLPPSLLGAVVILRFAWALFDSQIRQIKNAINGVKGSITAGLGLMSTIKEEVETLSKFINVIRFTHQIEYKIVITVDDLDRCPLDKVKSVLEAINVLLSDESSPFICLIVANPRVVSKCIEGEMADALIEARITGHEYIKKIINLPFCIPSVNSLRRYCEGVADVADGARNVDTQLGRQDSVDFIIDETTSQFISDDTQRPEKCGFANFESFEIKCRSLLEQSDEEGDNIHKFLIRNPRNVKRIMNVLMITLRLLKSIREKEIFFNWLSAKSFEPKRGKLDDPATSITYPVHVLQFGNDPGDASDLLKWIILTDQWPFMMSCIVYHIENGHYKETFEDRRSHIRRYSENGELLRILETVEKKLGKRHESCRLSSLDGNLTSLRNFLTEWDSLTIRRLVTLLQFTVNLDLSLQQEIKFLMY